jgi:hypothetical protein
MRTSTTQAQQGRSLVGTIVLALTAAAVMVGLSLGPAFSDDHDRRDRPQERGHRVYHPAYRAYPSYSYGYYQPNGYYQAPPPPVVYAPPPVVYVPPPSPGISLFFGFPHR